MAINKFIPNLYLLTLLLQLLIVHAIYPQQKTTISLVEAGKMTGGQAMGEEVNIFTGNVVFEHDSVLLYCDSAVFISKRNQLNAYKNVHIWFSDTLNVYGDKLDYNGNSRIANISENVKLEDNDATLTTDHLIYNRNTEIAYYTTDGKIVSDTNVLTSREGYYHTPTKIINFKKDVVLTNPSYRLSSDTLVYDTFTEIAYISGPTNIVGENEFLYAEDGWYDTHTGEAELLKNPVVYNENQQLKANYIKYNEADGKGRALGDVQMEDLESSIMVTGNTADYNKKLELALVTDSALFMMYSENDTLFLHADTLRTVPDTIENEKSITAWYGTRFFRSDLQGLCDSLVYFTKDSIVQLYQNPVIWSDVHQLSADLIEMKQFTDAPDELHLKSNSFIVSKLDSGRFDQIKGKDMVGYMVNNELKTIDVNGNGQTLYYARQKEEIIGLNRVESSRISIRFREGKAFRISFLQAPEGILKPLFALTEEEKTLSGFDWKIQLRPLSKNDVFWRKEPDLPLETEAEVSATSTDN